MAKRSLFWVSLVGAMAMLMISISPAFLTPKVAQASSHREAPLISQDPVADATDLFAFVSPENPNTVSIITNWIPYENAASGPNFFRFGDDVLYEIHVDNVGDAQDHMVFQFRFKTKIINGDTFLHNTGVVGENMDAEYNLRQYMYIDKLTAPADGSCKDQALSNCPTAVRTSIAADKEVAPANVGAKSFPVYPMTAAKVVHDLGNGMKVFAGPRADPFFADIGSLFDLLTIRNLPGNKGGGVNSFAGYNVHTISMQLPISMLTKDGTKPTDPNGGSSVLGFWTTSSRRATTVRGALGATSSSGNWVQIERLGMPLTNEVVIPLKLKDAFNNLMPSQDYKLIQAGTIPASIILQPELGKLLTALYGLTLPSGDRTDILAVFLTGVKGLNQPAGVVPSEQLRLNVAIPPTASGKESALGVLGNDLAGFPNGRRLKDDVIDIELRVVAGILVDPSVSPNNVLGDGVDFPARVNDLTGSFPYQALPYSGLLFGTSAQECKQSINNPYVQGYGGC
jgi:hypothetical protein